MLLKLAIFVLLVASAVQAVDFSCLATQITNAQTTGTLPSGANSTVTVPKGTNCTYTFNIPNGYALHILVSADFQSDNDTIVIVDNNMIPRSVLHTSYPIVNATIWLGTGTVQLKVVGDSGKGHFLARYSYQSLDGFVRNRRSTGKYISLSLVTGKNYYTFTSDKNDKVVATVGQSSSNSSDHVLENIFVYDGEDLSGRMMGRLADIGFSAVASSKTSLTLVNFYGTRSNSYLLANDASALNGYSKYAVLITSKGSQTRAKLQTASNSGAGYTYICIDCSEFYINQFLFDSVSTIVNLGYATLQGQSPTHGMEKLVNYTAESFTSNQLPQLVPSNMFTMYVYMSGIYVTTSTVNDDTQWKTPFEGRQGYLFSPNQWDSTASNSFIYSFRNDSQVFNYQLNLDKMQFAANSKNILGVIIGSGSTTSNPAVNNQYPRDSSSTGKVSSLGNYMQVTYSGSSTSNIRLSFQISKLSTSVGLFTYLIISLYYFL